MTGQLNAPVPLLLEHLVSDFHCGEPSLDHWLKRRAFPNQLSGASRTFVVTDAANRVVGYYALAAGAVAHSEATGSVKRNMPDPIPVIVLGRLAVDVQAQGIKLGAALLKDAVLRVHNVAESTGVRALVVHALNDKAKLFYERYGFSVSPVNPMILLLKLNTGQKR